MNQYGHKALKYWQQELPEEYAAIPDPQQHFTDLGLRMWDLIEQMIDRIVPPQSLSGDQTTDLPRLNEARMAAEEAVLRAMAYEVTTEEPTAEDLMETVEPVS